MLTPRKRSTRKTKINKTPQSKIELIDHLLPQNKLHKAVSISSQNFVMCKMGKFDEDYLIIRKIGEGSFGTVYEVYHKALKLTRAMKTIQKRKSQVSSSFQEIQILKKLDHPNVLKIYQFYESQHCYYIISDLFEGTELFQELLLTNKLSEQYAVEIIEEVLKALSYIHSLGIAHRDIKPENILISNTSALKIKIIDWGLSTLIGSHSASRVCGTPEYCAPEVFKGSYSLACDMWSLGVITYIMLIGEMPFTGKNTQETIQSTKKGIIKTKTKDFQKLSISARKFITSLIIKDPIKRMTASQSLKHQWVTMHAKSDKQPNCFKETLERLKEFTVKNSFGTAVLCLINNHFSSIAERSSLEEVFRYLDKNGDGVLSVQQLVEGYSKIYGKELAIKIAEETMQKLDINYSGTLEYSQFVGFALRRKQDEEIARLKEAFNLIDRDKSGTISCEQISNVLQCRVQGLTNQDIQQIIQEIDSNGDSQIDFEQFVNCVQEIHKKVTKEEIKIENLTKNLTKNKQKINNN